MIKRIGITEARAKFTELVDGVRLQGDHVILLKRGKPAAAMLPLSLYEQWQEQRRERLTVFQRVRTETSAIPIDDDALMQELEELKHEVRQLESK